MSHLTHMGSLTNVRVNFGQMRAMFVFVRAIQLVLVQCGLYAKKCRRCQGNFVRLSIFRAARAAIGLHILACALICSIFVSGCVDRSERSEEGRRFSNVEFQCERSFYGRTVCSTDGDDGVEFEMVPAFRDADNCGEIQGDCWYVSANEKLCVDRQKYVNALSCRGRLVTANPEGTIARCWVIRDRSRGWFAACVDPDKWSNAARSVTDEQLLRMAQTIDVRPISRSGAPDVCRCLVYGDARSCGMSEIVDPQRGDVLIQNTDRTDRGVVIFGFGKWKDQCLSASGCRADTWSVVRFGCSENRVDCEENVMVFSASNMIRSPIVVGIVSQDAVVRGNCMLAIARMMGGAPRPADPSPEVRANDDERDRSTSDVVPPR